MQEKDTQKRYVILARKWVNGTITDAEKTEFSEWYNSCQEETIEVDASFGTNQDEHSARIWEAIASEIRPESKTKSNVFRYMSAAAAVIAVLIGYYFYAEKINTSDSGVSQVTTVSPGSNRAFLTLADGSEIVLDRMSDGEIHKKGNLVITKEKGSVVYHAKSRQEQDLTYNTLRTPRGGQFMVALPDGSKVWLNAMSTLRYPTQVKDGAREVFLDGEGYFDIAELKGESGEKMPFRVHVRDSQVIDVLGTVFNVMAYSQEKKIETTLLNGSVRLAWPKTKKGDLLAPGQQALFDNLTGANSKKEFNVSEYVSWMNGMVIFNDADIQSITRELARWYDVDIVFDGIPTKRKFTGGFDRTTSLSAVIQVFEMYNIRLRQDGRSLIVGH